MSGRPAFPYPSASPRAGPAISPSAMPTRPGRAANFTGPRKRTLPACAATHGAGSRAIRTDTAFESMPRAKPVPALYALERPLPAYASGALDSLHAAARIQTIAVLTDIWACTPLFSPTGTRVKALLCDTLSGRGCDLAIQRKRAGETQSVSRPFYFVRLLWLHLGQRLFDIRQNIFNIFNTAGEPNQTRRNAGGGELRVRKLPVRGTGRVQHRGTHFRNVHFQ